jgi:hypothetical protein
MKPSIMTISSLKLLFLLHRHARFVMIKGFINLTLFVIDFDPLNFNFSNQICVLEDTKRVEFMKPLIMTISS